MPTPSAAKVTGTPPPPTATTPRRANGAAIHRPEPEADGDITVWPVTPLPRRHHRGAAPEDLDIAAIRGLIARTAAADGTPEALDPFWAAVRGRGECWHEPHPRGRRAVALYGLTGHGPSQRAAALDWFEAAIAATAAHALAATGGGPTRC